MGCRNLHEKKVRKKNLIISQIFKDKIITTTGFKQDKETILYNFQKEADLQFAKETVWSKRTQHFCQTQKKNISSSCNRVTKSTCDIFVRKFARFAIHPVFLAYKKQWFKSRLIGFFWISFLQTRPTAYWPICIFLRWVCTNIYLPCVSDFDDQVNFYLNFFLVQWFL